ncbi:MAG: tRNA (adenosine(37)-N6)-threonylcarbamoyltransferase complex dimerization subunit type 1 TsaB [Pseudomonadota bacterium]
MILGIDTSGPACGIALISADQVLIRRVERLERGHAERLFPMLRAALVEVGVGVEAIERIAVCIGPGSFTGLRVGVAGARGLALGRGVPAVGVTRFQALASAVARPGWPRPRGSEARLGDARPDGESASPVALVRPAPRPVEDKVGWAERRPLAVAIAGRGSVYLQLFQGDNASSDPAILAPEALAAAVPDDAVAMGDAWTLPAVDPKGPGGRGEPVLAPEALADPAVVAALGARAKPDRPPAPLYLRGADADPPREAPPPLLV